MNPLLAGVGVGVALMAAVWFVVLQWGDAIKRAVSKTAAEGEANHRPTVDYIEACVIVDRYIAPAVIGKLDIHKISIRKDFMDRFDRLTGAKVGEYEYNAKLLHEWMQSNAARFLIERRGDMS